MIFFTSKYHRLSAVSRQASHIGDDVVRRVFFKNPADQEDGEKIRPQPDSHINLFYSITYAPPQAIDVLLTTSSGYRSSADPQVEDMMITHNPPFGTEILRQSKDV